MGVKTSTASTSGKSKQPIGGSQETARFLVILLVIAVYAFYVYTSISENKLESVIRYYTLEGGTVEKTVIFLSSLIDDIDGKPGLFLLAVISKSVFLIYHFFAWFILLFLIVNTEIAVRLSCRECADFRSVFNPRVYHLYHKIRFMPAMIAFAYVFYLHIITPYTEFMFVLAIISFRMFVKYKLITNTPPVN